MTTQEFDKVTRATVERDGATTTGAPIVLITEQRFSWLARHSTLVSSMELAPKALMTRNCSRTVGVDMQHS